MYLIIIFIFSATLQTLRKEYKTKVSTLMKRCFRILGFLGGFYITLKVMFFLFLITFKFLIFSNPLERNTLKNNYKNTWLDKIMIIHQLHYFSYSYFMFIYLFQIFRDKRFMIFLIFSLSWIIYSIIPKVIKSNNYKEILFYGHLFLAFNMFFLGFFKNEYVITALWLITGIGGGTVYCIHKINEELKITTKNSVIVSEGIGHILGVFLGMIVYKVLGFSYIFYFSSILAFSVAILTKYFLRSQKEGKDV